MPAPDLWIEAALAITGDFETLGNPWIAVSGDFDGMGISCGPLQWNIGQNSLQPMVRNLGRETVGQAMPLLGSEMWAACTSPIAAGLSIVRSWQTGRRLRLEAQSEIQALLGLPMMRGEMLEKVRKVADHAHRLAGEWEQRPGKPSGPVFCWFFDLVTQNGGLKGLERADVEAFITAHGSERVDDTVCDWLAQRSPSGGHNRDAIRNADLWRNQASGAVLELLVLSYLRSQLAKVEWRHVVLNRKGTLAMGQGWVNSERYELQAQFPSTLGPTPGA